MTLWARPFRRGAPFQKGRALSHPPGQSEHATKGRALSKRAHPLQRGAPSPKGRALSKRGTPSPKGAQPLKRDSLPFCQAVSQELRMDEEIAKTRTSL